jgi:hypothetical protein
MLARPLNKALAEYERHREKRNVESQQLASGVPQDAQTERSSAQALVLLTTLLSYIPFCKIRLDRQSNTSLKNVKYT